jgi:hypothetical protein
VRKLIVAEFLTLDGSSYRLRAREASLSRRDRVDRTETRRKQIVPFWSCLTSLPAWQMTVGIKK